MRLSNFLLPLTMAWATNGAVLAMPQGDFAGGVLRAPSKCPNFALTDTAKLLGPEVKGCGWKLGLICASLAVGCPAGCLAAMIETAFNPLAITECTACMALTVGNCAGCFVALGGVEGYCNMSKKVPAATHCLSTMCNLAEIQKIEKTAQARFPLLGGSAFKLPTGATARGEESKSGLSENAVP